MKTFTLYPLAAAALALVSCEDFNDPVSNPGFASGRYPSRDSGPAMNGREPLAPGQFGTAVIGNTAFYKTEPQANQVADRLLDRGTPMKIVNVGSKHVKVELDSGEVGYVPKVMVTSGEPEDLPDPIDSGNFSQGSNEPPVKIHTLPDVEQSNHDLIDPLFDPEY